MQGESYEIPEKPSKQDWVFLITVEDLGDITYESVYEDATPAENIGNIVTPYKVTAVGGVYLKSGKKVDMTNLLYDMKGDDAWVPLADRVTQTIIYDLGAKYSVTQLNMVPATGTVLPDYRIEGSNDGESWTIIANTVLRDKNMSEDGTYIKEALQGNYRYIKVLLLNAKDISKDEATSGKYQVTYNEQNNDSYYSHTAIAEISVFASGLAPEDIENIEDNGGNKLILTVAVAGGALVLGAVVGLIVALIIGKKKEEN